MNDLYGYKIYDSIYPQMKIIETNKFILRPITLNDDADLFEFFSQDKVVRYLPIKKHNTIYDTRKFIKSFFIKNYSSGKIGNNAIFYKRDNKVIGNTGLNNVNLNSTEAEIGICLNPKYWGHDFATELTICTLIYGFELSSLNKLVALTYENNKYTPKSLKNLGFKYIKTYKSRKNNNICHRFELTRNEYYKLKENHLPNLVKNFNNHKH